MEKKYHKTKSQFFYLQHQLKSPASEYCMRKILNIIKTDYILKSRQIQSCRKILICGYLYIMFKDILCPISVLRNE